MKRQDDYLTKYTQRALERISEPNRSTIRQYLLFKEQVGQKPSTLASAVGVMVAMDRVVEGKRLTELTPDDLRAAVAAYATDHKPNCVLTFCAVLQAFYRWRYDDAIPPAIAKALKRKTRPIQPPARVVSEQEFRMLLDAARDARSKPQQLRDQAVLWTLWDSGFRISEMMSLRVSDLTFRDAGVELKLRELSPRLKTGARTIFLVEAAGALRLWLALHPYGDDPEAPLFPFDRQSPLHTTTVRIMVRNLCKDTGVKHVHPHAFRHTRATRCAEAGWNEAQLRKFFGWAAGSKYASYYVHLSQLALEERIRSDAKLDPLGAAVRADPNAALAAVIKATLEAFQVDPRNPNARRP